MTEANAQSDFLTESKGWMMGIGIVMILAGAASLLFPMFVTLSIEFLIGCLLLISGVVALVSAFGAQGLGRKLLGMLPALIYLVMGYIFLANPLAGILTLTILMAMFFGIDGLVRIILSLQLRDVDNWWMFLLSGLISLGLAIFIFAGLDDASTLAFLGILVGVNLLFAGAAYVAIASAIGKLSKAIGEADAAG